MQEALERFGQRVRELREARKMSQEELGKHLGVAKQTVSNWERGAAPPQLSGLIRLCAFFKVQPNDLLAPDGQLALNADDVSQVRLAAFSSVVPLRDMTTGGLMLAGKEKVVDPDAFIPTQFDHGRGAFGFVVSAKLARSMAPKFREGDRVVVDPDLIQEVEPGQAVLAIVGDEVVFRYWRPSASSKEIGHLMPSRRATEDGWPPLQMSNEDRLLAVMSEHSTSHHD